MSNLRFKVGDKVKIPKKKTPFNSYNNLLDNLIGYDKDYLIVIELWGNKEPNADYVLNIDGGKLRSSLFMDDDLEPYEEKKIYNIQDIKGKRIAILVHSQKETDVILSKVNRKHSYTYKDLVTSYKIDPCISILDGCYADKDWYKATEYDVIDFSQINFNNKMETKIPEKWYVKGGKELCKDGLFDKITNGALAGNSESGFYYKKEDGSWTYEYKPPTRHTEITVEQVKQIFNMSTRKLIGYKSPINLYQNTVVAGTLFFKPSNNHSWYVPKNRMPHNDQIVPGEIVETWEPVYEEEFKVGDWVTYIGGNGGINTDLWIPGKVTEQITRIDGDDLSVKWGSNIKGGFRKASPEEIKNATVVKIGAYTAEKVASHSIKFGCKTFSKVRLESLKEILKMKDMEYNPVFTVNGQNITIELIDKLLKM